MHVCMYVCVCENFRVCVACMYARVCVRMQVYMQTAAHTPRARTRNQPRNTYTIIGKESSIEKPAYALKNVVKAKYESRAGADTHQKMQQKRVVSLRLELWVAERYVRHDDVLLVDFAEDFNPLDPQRR